jgi:hypothetical protein
MMVLMVLIGRYPILTYYALSGLSGFLTLIDRALPYSENRGNALATKEFIIYLKILRGYICEIEKGMYICSRSERKVGIVYPKYSSVG